MKDAYRALDEAYKDAERALHTAQALTYLERMRLKDGAEPQGRMLSNAAGINHHLITIVGKLRAMVDGLENA